MNVHGSQQESAVALTGKFEFRKSLGGKIVLRVEEDVQRFWLRSKPKQP